MMNIPPEELGEAKVLYYTSIDERHKPTRNTVHRVNDNILGPAARLAICQYDTEKGFYLFYCDDEWEVMTDTYHFSLEDAQAQAELEYQGVSQTWRKLS